MKMARAMKAQNVLSMVRSSAFHGLDRRSNVRCRCLAASQLRQNGGYRLFGNFADFFHARGTNGSNLLFRLGNLGLKHSFACLAVCLNDSFRVIARLVANIDSVLAGGRKLLLVCNDSSVSFFLGLGCLGKITGDPVTAGFENGSYAR